MFEQKSSRLFPIPNATPYNFDHSVATGFPRLLPPIRKIGLGRRAVAGQLASDKQLDSGGASFESSLERDFFILLEFNPRVVRWDPQPCRIAVAQTGTTYVPDVLVSYADDPRDPATFRQVLYEVKYREQLRKEWSHYRPRFKAATRFAKEQGWQFRLVTEREIRSGELLWNAKFLLPFIHDHLLDGERGLLLSTLRRMDTATPSTLLASCSADPWEQARLLNALWVLVARGDVGTDLGRRLTMTSVIWCYG